MTTKFYNTLTAAAFLGVKPTTLGQNVWAGRVPAPARTPAGDFAWVVDDVRRAAKAMNRWTAELEKRINQG